MQRILTVLFVSTLALAACKSEKPSQAPVAEKTEKVTTPAPAATAPAAPSAPEVKLPDELYASLETSMGTIVVKLFPKDAPKTVANFVGLARGEKEWHDAKSGKKVKRPLYDGTIFHRVIPDFMVQAGDPLGNGTGGPGYRFEDEFQSGRSFDKPCLLAMANAGPNTNGSQFFITEKPTQWLNNRHTIFGEVVQGCELVAQMARVPRGQRDRPETDIVLKAVAISETLPQ
ncbi:MAG TPA: peptidylprolyl isomerase [Myxococcales bacterium]|jgi:peptidyl-prolyl cis-trans isomerase A (cyclophilin A)|nr:peptidylprolyl isomerase [Myxococcales bacterium]